jgi:hypothetical protein
MDDEVLANLSEIILSLDPNHYLPYETLKYVFENKDRLAHFTEDSVKHFPEILAVMKVGESDLCNEAARIGSLHLLNLYLRINIFIREKNIGFPWFCSLLATKPQIDLKIAHESGCEWDDVVCSTASTMGHLDCLVYACENGCPQDAHIIWDTRKSGEMECLRYLENRMRIANDHVW